MRFTDRTSPDTRIKVMTDGILLAELQRDRQLRRYDTIIIDEAHERSLNIDFLLGYLKQLLPRRPDLKLVITSATIDPERFARHFADRDGRPAPIIEVSGRTYPVEIRYRPLIDAAPDRRRGRGGRPRPDRGDPRRRPRAVRRGPRRHPGVPPGRARDPRHRRRAGRPEAGPRPTLEIVPLFSRLSAAEQHRVFSSHPATVRRVVLATNVAETSLTVPGIRYVVDTGLARISRYSLKTKVQRLPIEAISQASARQRSGRCGRVEAGIAIRLYAEEDFEGRPAFTDPEILRTNLASVILQMTSLGLGDVGRFPFVEPPDRRNVSAGVQLLEELGALGSTGGGRRRGDLTRVGRRLARLPIDPRLGRMILEAERLGCVREILVIAAALSLQDPRERPLEEQAQADQLHARFKDPTSDFLTWLNLWRHLRAQQRELSSQRVPPDVQAGVPQLPAGPRVAGLRVPAPPGVPGAQGRSRQGAGVVSTPCDDRAETPSPRRAGGAPYDADGIHQALLSGLLSHVGVLEERDRARPARPTRRPRGPREYLGARGTRFAIFPGSGLRGKNPAYLMAGELVETGRLWARQNAAIKPEWAEQVGAHLVKRTYSEPHWSRKRAAVMAYERVTLYGVPLVTDRLVAFGKIDRELSRELFIRHALVYGEWSSRHRFLGENQRLLEEAEELEHRARRRDIVVDEQTLFDFYDARIGRRGRQRRPLRPVVEAGAPHAARPAHLRPGDAHPRHGRGGAGRGLPRGLAGRGPDLPDQLPLRARRGRRRAHHRRARRDPQPRRRRRLLVERPRCPPRAGHQPDPEPAEEPPGQLRAGPRQGARVPGHDPARRGAAARRSGALGAVDDGRASSRATPGTGPRCRPTSSPTYRVVGETGDEQARGKDLEALKAPLRDQFDEALAAVADDSGLGATGQTAWTFGEMPDEILQTRAGHEVLAHPAVTDEGTTVGLGRLRLARRGRGAPPARRTTPAAARAPRRRPDRATSTPPHRLGLAGSPYPTVAELLDDLRGAILADVVDARPPVRTPEEYAALLAVGREALEARTRPVLTEVLRILSDWRDVDRMLSGRAELATLPALQDMREQLARLVSRGFLGEAGAERLRRFPTYLLAVRRRRERLEDDVLRDRQLMDQVTGVEDAVLHQLAALPDGRPPGERLRRARWLLEEYRVSLFAQQLGTDGPVSDQRIRTLLTV